MPASLLLFLLFLAAPQPTEEALAELRGVDGASVSGTVRFTAFDEGVRVMARVRGLADGLHGFHVHAGTDCAAPGGPFDPAGRPHGGPLDPPTHRHAGDLGNVASDDGLARYDRLDPVLTLDGPDTIVGRVVVVHAGQDDLNTLPDGAAGPVVACGVIAPVR